MFASSALRNIFHSAPPQNPVDTPINPGFRDALDFYAAHNSIVITPEPKPPLSKVSRAGNKALTLAQHAAHRLSKISEADEDVLSLRSVSSAPAVPPKSVRRAQSMPSRSRPALRDMSAAPPVPPKNPARLYTPLVEKPTVPPRNPQRSLSVSALNKHTPSNFSSTVPYANVALSPVFERSEVSLAPQSTGRKALNSVKAYFDRASDHSPRNALLRSKEWLRNAAEKYSI